MTEEIKEMLHCIEMNCKHNKCFGGFKLDKEDCELLLKYIKELEDYKSRCEKAIEYIKEHIKYECDDNFNGMSFYSYHLYDFKKEDLLNILNGSDEK